MASVNTSSLGEDGSDNDNENQIIIICGHCSLETVQISGTRRRTICPHCGNFYTSNSGRDPRYLNSLNSYQGGDLLSSSLNSGSRKQQSLPSIAKTNGKSSGPLRSITNFFKKLGPRERNRKNNEQDKAYLRTSPLSRLASSSHSQLPPINQDGMLSVESGAYSHASSPRLISGLRMINSNGDLSPQTQSSESSGQSLTQILAKSIENLEDDISLAKESNDWRDVKDYFAAVFDNSSNLNAAFRKSNVEGGKTSECDMDLERIYNVYDILISMPSDVQKIALKAIIGNLLKDKRMHSKEEIKTYAILLLNPQFHSPSTYTIFAHLLRQISLLKDHQHHYLVHWSKSTSSVQFKEEIHRIQKFISSRLMPSKQGDLPPLNQCLWWLPTATKVLALLNAASNLCTPPIVSYQEFYNSSIDNLDLLAEYFNWQCSNGSNRFSFCQYPFILSITAKRTILQKDSEQQMVVMARKSLVAKVQQHQLPEIGMLFLNLTVRRSHLVSDSLNEIARKQSELKKKLKVTFSGEPGLDMGGLTKEWFLLLTRQIFQPEFGMFTHDKMSKVFWFSSTPCDNFQEFNLVGVLMGLAVYNSIILDIRFPPICYKKILSPAVVPTNIQKAIVGVTKVNLEDLKAVHPEVARGLHELLEYDGDVEDDLGVTFQITYNELGSPVTHDLKPNGENIPVTNSNREEYVQLYVEFVLNQSIYRQFQAFYHGFHSVCASNALILLRPEEIELLVCGNPSLDMNELRKVTVYDGYTSESETIKFFWDVVMSMSIDVQKQLLLFTTGSDRIPVGGMAEMQFKITRVENVNMLPMSQTCFNQLVLPIYRSRKVLKQKLFVAIHNAEGFGLE